MASTKAALKASFRVLLAAVIAALAPGTGAYRAAAQFTSAAPVEVPTGGLRFGLGSQGSVETSAPLAADVGEGIRSFTNLGPSGVAELPVRSEAPRAQASLPAMLPSAGDLRQIVAIQERLADRPQIPQTLPPSQGLPANAVAETREPSLPLRAGSSRSGTSRDAVPGSEAERAALEENPVTRPGALAVKKAGAAKFEQRPEADSLLPVDFSPGGVAQALGLGLQVPGEGAGSAMPQAETVPLNVAAPAGGRSRLVAAFGLLAGSVFFWAPRAIFAQGNGRAEKVAEKAGQALEEAVRQPGLVEQPLFWVGVGAALAAGLLVLARRRIGALILRARQAVARLEESRAANLPAEKESGLPLSYWLFFSGALLNQFGSWMGAVLIPLYAATQVSPEFALVVQGTLYLFLIGGNLVGAKWAKKYNSRLIFVAGGAGTALAILAAALTGSLGLAPFAFMAGFLAARALGGLSGGMVMGVGESTIMTEMLGKNKRLLERGNALYSIANFGMGALAPALAALLVPILGPAALIFIAAGALALSLVPMLLINLKPQAPSAAGTAASGEAHRDSIPKAVKGAFILASFIRLAFFGLIGPLFALAVFASPTIAVLGSTWALAGLLVGAYSLGSLISASLMSAGLGLKISEKWWFAGTGLAWALFAAASFFLGASPLLALGAAVLLGFMVQGALSKLRGTIQAGVDPASQPKLFMTLFNLTVGSLTSVFLLLKVAPALGLGVSMFGLLAGMSVAVAVLGAVLAAALLRTSPPAKG